MRLNEAHSEMAWELFYTYYAGFIRTLVSRRNLPCADIDDLTQTICLQCWKALRKGQYDKDKGRFRAWLATLCANAVNSHLRSFQRHLRDQTALREADLFPEEGQDPPVDESIDKEWLNHLVQLAWEEAKLHFNAQILDMYQRLMAGDSPHKVAADLDMRLNTVYVYRNRVEASLAKYIRQLDAHL